MLLSVKTILHQVIADILQHGWRAFHPSGIAQTEAIILITDMNGNAVAILHHDGHHARSSTGKHQVNGILVGHRSMQCSDTMQGVNT